MNLGEIEDRVAAIMPSPGVEFLGELLLAYGLPKMSVARLMSGSTNKAEAPNERLLKGKVFFAAVDDPDDTLYELIDAARDDALVLKHKPRFLIVKNQARLLAGDQKTGETLDIAVEDLSVNTTFFLPWAGVEKTQLENLNYADVKAAEKMAKLYDEITRHNSIDGDDDVHDLNVFFSRLLFCFFAEDTGVFETGSFTNAIGSFTQGTGVDTHSFLDQLFEVLDRDLDDRDGVPAHLKGFGYVNGNLFARRCPAPRFSAKARAIVLECGTLDWSQINPDIFGSMMQAVVHPTQRAGLGMHYTSIENIMKVIRPLFLDELEEAFERADTMPKLERLLKRIAGIQIFDPACGSGNFLIISYKELRKLEHRILQRLIDLDKKGRSLFKESALKLENFYGIEIDDFAHEIAILSLWLAKHQMNAEFKDLFGTEIPLIPLRDSGKVICANATRVEWADICDPDLGSETFVLGNPPYLGSKLQQPQHKGDFEEYFGTAKYPRDLDYISLWFLKGSAFVARHGGSLGFVSTNSISQGKHTALLWPRVFAEGVEISFGHQSFLWSNAARGKAGVACIIVGLSANPPSRRPLYTNGAMRMAGHINAYMRPSARDTIVGARSTPMTGGFPEIREGSRPNDGGGLILTPEERRQIISHDDRVAPFIKRYMGTREFLNGIERYCIWIRDEDAEAATAIPELGARFETVAGVRERGGASARGKAATPHRFDHRVHREGNAIIVPGASSERRDYIPIGFLDGDTVVSNLAYAVYGAKPWVFGLVQSRLHVLWAEMVAGRMKTDIRYSGTLCYNTFPVPPLDVSAKKELASMAFGVLEAREHHAHATLAQLYDPESMPVHLRRAHELLDEAVETLYRSRAFQSDDERVEHLLDMYEAAVRRLVDA